jgi:hypothetical protein
MGIEMETPAPAVKETPVEPVATKKAAAKPTKGGKK